MLQLRQVHQLHNRLDVQPHHITWRDSSIGCFQSGLIRIDDFQNLVHSFRHLHSAHTFMFQFT